MFSIVKSIWRPIYLVKTKQPAVFWTSLGIALVAGQAGILFAFLGAIGRTPTFTDVLVSNLSNANFYTFSISLLASAVVPLAVEYVDAGYREDKVVLTSQKLLASMLAFLLVLTAAGMAGIFTSVSLAPGPLTSNLPPSDKLNAGSWLQLAIYALSILAAAYLISISRIHFNLDDLAEMTRQETRSRADTAHKMTSTIDGEEL